MSSIEQLEQQQAEIERKLREARALQEKEQSFRNAVELAAKQSLTDIQARIRADAIQRHTEHLAFIDSLFKAEQSPEPRPEIPEVFKDTTNEAN